MPLKRSVRSFKRSTWALECTNYTGCRDEMKRFSSFNKQRTLEEAGSEQHFGTVLMAHVSETTHLLKDSTAKLGKTYL